MDYQDAKTQTSKQAKGETDSQNPAHGWRPIFRGAVGELFSGSWIQNLLVGFALLLIWPAIGAFIMKSQRALIIGFGIGATILIWIAVIILARQVGDTEITPHPTPSPSPAPSPSPSPSPVASASPAPYPVPSSSPSSELSPQSPEPTATANPSPTQAEEIDLSAPASRVGGTGAPLQTWRHPTSYDHVKWTDYKEDYFYDAIWRWEYRPEMGNTPRNIRGFCPECGNEIKPQWSEKRDDGKFMSVTFVCASHPFKQYKTQGDGSDPYGRIRLSIQRKLKSGLWQEVVRQQWRARSGET